MRQISDKVFVDASLFDLEVATPLLSSPYAIYPFLIIKNFLAPSICQEIITYCQEDQEATTAKLRSSKHGLDQHIRKTKIHQLTPQYLQIYEKALAPIRSQIERFFTLSLTQATGPQVLEYTKGSFYKAHSDDSSVLVDKEGHLKGYKQVAPQRKVTTLLMLSQAGSDFQGGALQFNHFKDDAGVLLKLSLDQGDMVVFGSNPYYTHEVFEVTQGYRLSIAQWHDALL